MVCIGVTGFPIQCHSTLKCSVINSCRFSVNLHCRFTKTVWKNILRVLESSGKVLEFRASNLVGTLGVG